MGEEPRVTPAGSPGGRQQGWRELASCVGKPTAWWFPGAGSRGNTARALAVCAECDVRAECADELRQVEEQVGIIVRGVWAGTTEEDRRQGRKRAVRRDVPRSCPVCENTILVAATGIVPTYCSNPCAQRAQYRRSKGAPVSDAEFTRNRAS